MIDDELEYRTTLDQLLRFERTLAAVRTRPIESRLKSSRLRQAEEDGIESIIEELRAKVAQYESRQSPNEFAVGALPERV